MSISCHTNKIPYIFPTAKTEKKIKLFFLWCFLMEIYYIIKYKPAHQIKTQLNRKLYIRRCYSGGGGGVGVGDYYLAVNSFTISVHCTSTCHPSMLFGHSSTSRHLPYLTDVRLCTQQTQPFT